jgi:two-component system, LytTR family, response regulator
MKKIKAIAIDDNQSALNIIESLSKKLDYLELSATFLTALEAGNYLKTHGNIDLIFLDINMPEMNGLEFLRTFKPEQAVIFISKHVEHAVDSYDLENEYGIQVIDFLPLPVQQARFIRACNKALENIKSASGSIILKDKSKKYRVKHDAIILIEADEDDKHLMKFYLTGAIGTQSRNEVLIRKSLSELEEELPSDKFMRVSKNAIVNLDKVEMLEGDEIITCQPNKKLVLGDKWKQKFEEKIHKRK